MNKVYFKRTIGVVAVVCLTIGILWYMNSVFVLKRTDGITSMKSLYAQQENTVDVLFLGSSRIGMNLDLESMWTNHGIAGYTLWGSVQPFWNSYYFMLEALKTQTPEVVVLETYAASFQFEYSDEARQITNTAGMHYGVNRLMAAMASAEDGRVLNLFLGWPLYHQRYGELTKNDFSYFPWSEDLRENKANDVRYGEGTFELQDVSGVTECAQMHPKEEKYLRMIIEACQDNEIPILLITTPTPNRLAEQPYYNSVDMIAKEYGIEYINYNLMDGQTGLEAEDYWLDGHMNTNGARKVSSHLADVLRRDYQVSDRRSQEKWKSWDVFARTIQNKYICEISSTEDYFAELSRNDRSLFIVKNSSWDSTVEWDNLLSNLASVGVDLDILRASGGGDWMLSSTQNGSFENKYFGDMYSEFIFDGQVFSMDFKGNGGLAFNNETLYHLNGPGIICLVYDNETGSCVDIVTFLQKDQFSLRHVIVR